MCLAGHEVNDSEIQLNTIENEQQKENLAADHFFSSLLDTPEGAQGALYYKGLIDEVELYNRALRPTEIQAIYRAGSWGKCKPRFAVVAGD